jgi:3-dehydroquinate synthase
MLFYFANEAIKALKKQLKEYKKAGKSVFILCDNHTQEHCLPLLQRYILFDFIEDVFVIQSGEEHKNIETAAYLWQKLLNKNADRNAVLLCLGGGVVCDMGGFVAATFKRGIDYVFIPTSLLAQVDASIGGKTAVNFNGFKNQIGLFYQPKMLCTIPEFLTTLPKKEVLSGSVEMLKHGLIANKIYWEELKNISNPSQMIQPELIKKSITIKMSICHADMYDVGERKKLNFGHTIGHALESFALLTSTKLSHGEAVAMGMIAESHISYQKKMINKKDLIPITRVLRCFFPSYLIEKKDYDTILSYLQKDKKTINNKVNFTLLSTIGNAVIDNQVSQNEIISAMDYLLHIQPH